MSGNFTILKDNVKREIEKGAGIWSAINRHVNKYNNMAHLCAMEDHTLYVKKEKNGKIRYEEGMTNIDIALVNVQNKLYDCF